MVKNVINVHFVSLCKKKKKLPKVTPPRRTVVKVSEKEWFKRKFQREFDIRLKSVIFSTIKKKYEKQLAKRQKLRPHHEPPRHLDYPDIVWDGSHLKSCFCLSLMHRCDCQDYKVLQRRSIPYGISNKLLPLLRKCRKVLRLEDMNLNLPDTPFVARLIEHIEIEKQVEKELRDMDGDRGLEFCVMRCHHRFKKLDKDHPYFKLRQDLYNEIKYSRVPKPAPPRPPKPKPVVRGPCISDSFTEGFYRSGGTQATTDKNGEFIIGRFSHILFGRYSPYVQDIEGTGLCLNSYQEIKEKQKVIKQIENLLSLTRMKDKVSKLTLNFMTSIFEIKDPGIPMNAVATQDPPLGYCYKSIIIPSRTGFVREVGFGGCPPCKDVKKTQKQDPRVSGRDVNTKGEIIKPILDEENKDINENQVKQNPNPAAKDVKDDPTPKDAELVLQKPLQSEVQHVRDVLLGSVDENTEVKEGIPVASTTGDSKLDGDKNEDIKNNNSDDGQMDGQKVDRKSSTEDDKDVNRNTPTAQIATTDTKIVSEGKSVLTDGGCDGVKEVKIAFMNINNQRQSCPEFRKYIKTTDNLHNYLDLNVSLTEYVENLLEDMLTCGLHQCFGREERQLYQQKHQTRSDEETYSKLKDDLLTAIENIVLNAKPDAVEKVKTTDTTLNIYESIKLKFMLNILLEFVRKHKRSLKEKFKRNDEESLKSQITRLFRIEEAKLKINNLFEKIKTTLISFLKSRQEKLITVTKNFLKMKQTNLNINRSGDIKCEQISEIDAEQKLSESTNTNSTVPQSHSSFDILPSNSKK